MKDGSQRRLRIDNRAALVDELRTRGPLTRGELVTFTGLSRTTVSTLLAELIDLGLVSDSPNGEEGDGKRTGGRPSRRIRLEASAGAAVSVDIGARHLAVAIGDLGHRVLARRWIALEYGHGVESGLAAASRLVDELLAEAGLDRDLVIGTAVGLPAPISHQGIIASTNTLPWLGRRPPRRRAVGATADADGRRQRRQPRRPR